MSTDAPIDLYIAAYDDPAAAQQDWDAIKGLVKEKLITVDGLVLVSRGEDGKIEVKDDASDVGVGAVLGAVGGAIIGLIFPPAFLASALVRRWDRRRHGSAARSPSQERDQGGRRRHAAAGQFGDRGAVRGALGRRCREGAREGRQGQQARGRRLKRRRRQAGSS